VPSVSSTNFGKEHEGADSVVQLNVAGPRRHADALSVLDGIQRTLIRQLSASIRGRSSTVEYHLFEIRRIWSTMLNCTHSRQNIVDPSTFTGKAFSPLG